MKAPKIFAEGHQSLSYFMNAALNIIRHKVSERANLISKTNSIFSQYSNLQYRYVLLDVQLTCWRSFGISGCGLRIGLCVAQWKPGYETLELFAGLIIITSLIIFIISFWTHLWILDWALCVLVCTSYIESESDFSFYVKHLQFCIWLGQ